MVGGDNDHTVAKFDGVVASIIRRGKCRVPSGNDAIELGDRVVVVTTNHGMHELKDIQK